MLVDEVEGTTQLVESCKMYFSSELFVTELECLACFNHYVTFPFLNLIETSSQADLLVQLPEEVCCCNSWNVDPNNFK